jgi:hypothetical protein
MLYDAAFGNGRFAAVGENTILTAKNPRQTWTKETAPAGQYRGVCYGLDHFVAVGLGGLAAWRDDQDGSAWNEIAGMPVADWNKIAYGNGKYIAVADGMGADGKVAVSSNPDSGWTIRTIPTGYGADIYFDNGLFVLVGRSGALVTANGVDFTAKTLPAATYRTVASHEGRIVVLGGKCVVSTDGLDTHTEADVPRGGWDAVEYGGGFYAAVGGGSAYMVTKTDITGGVLVPLVWDEREKLNYALLGIAFGVDTFVGVGDGIQVAGVIDVRAALSASNSPSATNPFATNADIEGIAAAQAQAATEIAETLEALAGRVTALEEAVADGEIILDGGTV